MQVSSEQTKFTDKGPISKKKTKKGWGEQKKEGAMKWGMERKKKEDK